MSKKYPTDVLEQAQAILSAWTIVGVSTTLGTLVARRPLSRCHGSSTD